MLENGFIKLHRSLLKWEWYDDLNTCRLFIHLLIAANYEANTWRGNVIERGQYLTSIESLSQQTKLTPMQVRISLNKLKSTGEITSKSTNKNTVISINNYDLYQCDNKQLNIPTTNKQQTSNKQHNNKERNKESNKDKKDKEVKTFYADKVSLTDDEYQKLIEKFGEETTKQSIEILNNYKISSGKKYKSDYHTILGWPSERAIENQNKEKQNFYKPKGKQEIIPEWMQNNGETKEVNKKTVEEQQQFKYKLEQLLRGGK